MAILAGMWSVSAKRECQDIVRETDNKSECHKNQLALLDLMSIASAVPFPKVYICQLLKLRYISEANNISVRSCGWLSQQSVRLPQPVPAIHKLIPFRTLRTQKVLSSPESNHFLPLAMGGHELVNPRFVWSLLRIAQ